MKFEQVMDKDWVKIFRISEIADIGLVYGEQDYPETGPEKRGMISLIVPDADAWFRYFKEKRIKTDL